METKTNRQEEILAYLSEVIYKNWRFNVQPCGGGSYLQVEFEPIADPGQIGLAYEVIQCGRKWYVSNHATKSEIIQTAFKAVLTAEEHEVREFFQYKGVAVFAPHFDVDRLAESIRAGEIPQDARQHLDFSKL